MNPQQNDHDRRFARFGRLIAGATLAMVALSWPLWVDGGTFPRVPFVARWPEPAPTLGWVRFAILVGAMAAVVAGRGGRSAWLLSLVGFVWEVLGDQNRWQPWVQQYVVVAFAVVLIRRDRASSLARWYLAVLYAASGLSKLDPAFVDEVGGTFLATLGHLVDMTPEAWPAGVRTGAILAMPLAEVAIAVALVIPRTRPWGLVAAVVQHLGLIAILGPWALNHSAIVLVWNGAIIAEDLVLFGPPRTAWLPREGAIRTAGLVAVIVVGAERWGWVDSWPAHALYASHAERSSVDWPDSEADALPPPIRRWLGSPDDAGFRQLDLTGWSRAELGVPVYPQNRVACGIAEALVERFAAPNGPPVRVIFWGRAGISRQLPRVRSECVNLPALQRRGDRFRINARPAGRFGRRPDPG